MSPQEEEEEEVQARTGREQLAPDSMTFDVPLIAFENPIIARLGSLDRTALANAAAQMRMRPERLMEILSARKGTREEIAKITTYGGK